MKNKRPILCSELHGFFTNALTLTDETVFEALASNSVFAQLWRRKKGGGFKNSHAKMVISSFNSMELPPIPQVKTITANMSTTLLPALSYQVSTVPKLPRLHTGYGWDFMVPFLSFGGEKCIFFFLRGWICYCYS